MPDRTAVIKRETKETAIEIFLNLDGKGSTEIETGVPFFDHMLDLLGRHGLFDLKIKAKGDLEVDAHHTVEDVGICLGQAVRQSLGDKKGISRFGSATVPMDESLVLAAIDISGRGHLVYDADVPVEMLGTFDTSLVIEFLHAFINHAAITAHVRLITGRNTHHKIEAVFKALARALDQATSIDTRVMEVPSTKGKI
jgi:imidazoleglycerol-phosphate dehydratase